LICTAPLAYNESMDIGTIAVRLRYRLEDGSLEPLTETDRLDNHAALFHRIVGPLSDPNLVDVHIIAAFESRCAQVESMLGLAERVLHKVHLVPAEELAPMLLIIHEAISNAVYHGNLRVPEQVRLSKSFVEYEEELERSQPELLRKTVQLDIRLSGEGAEVTVSDSGGGFDYEHHMTRDRPPSPEQETGRGIFLLRQTVDDITFRDNGETIHLKRKWRGHA